MVRGARDDSDLESRAPLDRVTDLGDVSSRMGAHYVTGKAGRVIHACDFSEDCGGWQLWANNAWYAPLWSNQLSRSGGCSLLVEYGGGVHNNGSLVRMFEPPMPAMLRVHVTFYCPSGMDTWAVFVNYQWQNKYTWLKIRFSQEAYCWQYFYGEEQWADIPDQPKNRAMINGWHDLAFRIDLRIGQWVDIVHDGQWMDAAGVPASWVTYADADQLWMAFNHESTFSVPFPVCYDSVVVTLGDEG